MLSDVLQDRAALYVSGSMPAAEREAFEVLLEFDAALAAHVAALQEAAALSLLGPRPALAAPPATLRERILAAAAATPQDSPDALVVTDANGGVLWINAAFSGMCGYSLEELRGKKPGRVLQGRDTDAATVARIRAAVAERRPCREQLVNYHKDGHPYRADVRIAPILDDDAQPLYFVARERVLAS